MSKALYQIFFSLYLDSRNLQNKRLKRLDIFLTSLVINHHKEHFKTKLHSAVPGSYLLIVPLALFIQADNLV